MTTSTVAPEIAKFAAAVREALADLPDEERDELTDGLEADLSESLAEDLRRTLPDPVAYAAELRAAAGLPARVRKRGPFAGLAQGWRDTRTDIGIAIRRNPALGGMLDFANSLRPLWWVLRAWLAAWLVSAVFGIERGYGFSAGWWLVLAAFIVVSVQWGRGRWLAGWVPPLIVIGNVIAVVALLPVFAAAHSPSYAETFVADANPAPVGGLAMNGHQISNIYAYGLDGKPLRQVQLFDQSGQPLDPFGTRPGDDGPCTTDDCSAYIQPQTLETGQSAYNIFPWSTIRSQWSDEQGRNIPAPGATPSEPKAPFLKVPAVLDTKKVAKSTH